MLCITRRVNEAILLPGDISVRCLAVRKNRVQLGICAPPAVAILREELAGEQREKERKNQRKKERNLAFRTEPGARADVRNPKRCASNPNAKCETGPSVFTRRVSP